MLRRGNNNGREYTRHRYSRGFGGVSHDEPREKKHDPREGHNQRRRPTGFSRSPIATVADAAVCLFSLSLFISFFLCNMSTTPVYTKASKKRSRRDFLRRDILTTTTTTMTNVEHRSKAVLNQLVEQVIRLFRAARAVTTLCTVLLGFIICTMLFIVFIIKEMKRK